MCTTMGRWCLVYLMFLWNCTGYIELSSREICNGWVEKVRGGRSHDPCAMKVTLLTKCVAVLSGWIQYTLSFSRVEEQGQCSKAGGWILEQKDYVGWICDTHHAFWED